MHNDGRATPTDAARAHTVPSTKTRVILDR